MGDGLKECGSDTCVGREVLLIDGTCEACGDYTRISSDRKACISTCESNEKVLISGLCE